MFLRRAKRWRFVRVGPRGFSLVELLVSTAIIGLLAAFLLPAVSRMVEIGYAARCANSLRSLGAATQLYLADHGQRFFPYYEDLPDGSRLWFFGTEPSSSMGAGEGDREISATEAPLYPYLQSVGKIEVCPAFPYGKDYWKPKFKGASYGYGYNIYLSPNQKETPTSPTKPTPISALALPEPSKILLFGDCAQVNDFQSPASASNPLLEEFYFIDDTYKTVHFRHGGRANMLFVDGHVQSFQPYPGTLDSRLPGEILGRITPRRSTEYLK